MKNEEIIAGNELIARFMGGKMSSHLPIGLTRERMSDNEIWLPIHGICKYHSIEVGTGRMLEYHKNWSWLMPVAEKIESLDFVVQIHLGSCFIKSHEQFIAFKGQYTAKSQGKVKIDAVYEAVIEFIKWCNQNKQS